MHRIFYFNLIALFICLSIGHLYSQEKTISGKIISGSDPMPLAGVTVMVKGTQIGAITDKSGQFTLQVPENAETLLFSFIGYERNEISIGQATNFQVVMTPTDLILDEVVVTAFGLERDKKALGYAVQQINANELSEARSTNIINNLSGKVAGIQVASSTGVGGGAQVLLRGNTTILGDNQPLYVIDGVPMEKGFPNPFSTSENNLYGGGISEVSPDNVESISVLKGANATALYGARGANGVVLITTKSGQGSTGLGIEYNANITFEKPFVVPEFQDIYGGGNGYVSWYHDGRNGGITDPVEIEQFQNTYGLSYPLVGTAGVDESWGAPMDGRLVRTWWSGDDVAPLAPVPDSWENFWETGTSITHNFAISSSNDKGSFRLAMGRLDQKGIMYNNDYYRNNFRLNTNYSLTEKFKVSVSAEYIKSGSENRQQPVLWEPQTWHHRHDDWGLMKEWEQFMDVHNTREGDEYPYANWQHSFAINRFYEQTVLTDANEKDRFLGNISLNYAFTNDLNLLFRAGTDVWMDTRVDVYRNERVKSFTTRTQAFEEQILRKQENNVDIILSFNKNLNDIFSLDAKAGGMHRTNYYKRNYTNVNDVTINGLHNLGNNATPNTDVSGIYEKEVQSVFGAASIGYKGYLFLDLTARNDWSSTLPVDNNSYFYPSVSMSAILSDMFDIQSPVLSLAKIRASWAQVGNDTDPYQLAQVFKSQNPWNANTPIFAENTILANSSLRPEQTESYEVGADIRLFNNKVGIDITYYDQATTDQIMTIEVSKAAGYDKKVINAGKITNKGLELMLRARVIDTKSFSWDISVNYARNRNKVEELFTDEFGNTLETIVLHSRRGLSLQARVGEAYGTLFGSAYKRVSDGLYAGQIVFKDGIPQKEDELQIIGNITPDWTGGIQNTFNYKGFAVSALIDAKIGGDIADESTSTGMQTGIYPITALGREEGVIGVGVKNIGSEERPEYVINDVVQPTKSVTRMLSVRSVNEGAVFEATYVKLREVRIGYTLPATTLASIGIIKGASFSFVGRNVAMLYNSHPQIDPDINIYGGNLLGALYYMTIPSTRSLGVNVNLKF